MPGTILVSAVGPMDLPEAEAGASSFTLKVAMGRREYQSTGQCHCSVPLVSLRENLIVVLHDLDGNEIVEAEFRTISVVENGVVENSYPLKSGGYVQMKLQFSLSQEERMLIREKRESALKRKREEQLRAETRSSLSITNGGSVVDQEEQKDPVKDSLQLDLASSSSGSLGLDAASQGSEQPSELRVEGDGCQVLIETSEENLKILQLPIDDGVNKSQSETRSLASDHVGEHMSSGSSAPKENQNRSNVKKMISLFQAPDIHKLKPHQIISKSISSGTLSDMNSHRNPIRSVFLKKREQTEQADRAKRRETMGDGKPCLQSENETMRTEKTVDIQEAAEISIVTPDAMPSSHDDEELKAGSKDVKIEDVQVKDQDKECDRHGSPLIHADEEIASVTPNGDVNILSYPGNDGSSCGIHDVWTSRRLCITTGSSQLSDLVAIVSGDQQKPDDDDDTLIQADENAKGSCQSLKTNHENSVGVTKLNRGLIEQGVRISIMLVACGALIFNTQQR